MMKQMSIHMLVCMAVVLTAWLVAGCDNVQRSDQKSRRELRRDRVLQLINTKYAASRVVHEHRSVADLRLDATYTTIERGTVLPEIGVYDLVWVQRHGCFYAFVQYYVDVSDRTFEFTAAWPVYDSDTLYDVDTSQGVYLMIEHSRARQRTMDTTRATTMVTTNVESQEDIRNIVGHAIDVLRKRPADIAVSYELLGSQPMNFILNIRLDGREIRRYSPLANLSY
jgi:hypothetical protein